MTNRISKRLSLSSLLGSRKRLSAVTKFEKPSIIPAKYSQDILEENGILILETSDLITGAISDISTLCGETILTSPTTASDIEDLRRNLNSRKRNTSKQITSFLSYFFEGVAGTQEFNQQVCRAYHSNVLPTYGLSGGKAHRLESPQPNLSFGYNKADFVGFFDDQLQDDIITAPDGDLIDLSKVSQPIKAHYWPFFVVEISEVSMLAARRAAAVAAASCNHAVKLLSYGAACHADEEKGSSETDPANSFDICFSLTVYGQIATFNVHAPRGPVEYLAVALKTYRLTEWQDLADLATSVRCIMTWARSKRLGALIGKLQVLERKVKVVKASSDLDMEWASNRFNSTIHGFADPWSAQERQEIKRAVVNIYPSWAKTDETGLIESWI